jgi:hypothetical protein
LQEWMIHRMSNVTPTIRWRLLHKSDHLDGHRLLSLYREPMLPRYLKPNNHHLA